MKIFIFFSHHLLKEQKEELKKDFFCEEIVFLPENLQNLWSNIDEEGDCFNLFKEFLEKNSKKGDYVLIQGEWGVTYKMVNYSKDKELIPIYSFSKRKVNEEIKNGIVIKTSYFKHIKFKKY